MNQLTMLTFIFTNTPLKFFVQSIWRDEAFSYVLAKQNIPDLIVLTAKDFNPPLYYIALKIWMVFFGSSEIAMRSLSLVFFWATIFVVYLFLRKIINIDRKKSALYILIFVLNPLLIYYAFEARMYMMFVFFASLSFYSYLKGKSKLYVAATILGLFTHYFMTLVVLTQFVFSFLPKKEKSTSHLPIKKLFLPILTFIPWFLFVLKQKSTITESFWVPAPLFKDILTIPSLIYTGYEKQLGFLALDSRVEMPFLLGISILIIAMIVVGFAKIRKNPLFLFFALWAFLPSLLIFFLSFYKSLFLPRYLIFTNIGLLLLIVLILLNIKTKLRIAFIVLLTLLTLNYHFLQLKYRVKSDYEKTYKEIKALAGKDDLVYVTNELDFFTAEYYFDRNRVFIYNKSYEELPSYVGKSLIPKEKITRTLPLYPKKAFVLKDDQHYDIESMR